MTAKHSKPQHSIDDLDSDYKILASLVRSVEEEQHVFDFWIAHDYDTARAIRELHRIRLRIRDRERRQRKRRRHPGRYTDLLIEPEACAPEDLVSDLTEREDRIWRMRAEGLTYEEIAGRVGCARSTVYEDLNRIQIKLEKNL